MRYITIPTNLDVVPETIELMKRWGADAIRDCDGTEFPEELVRTGAKIYATYYTTRKDNEWAKANPDEVQQCYVMTSFYTAVDTDLEIPLMKGISQELMMVNTRDDKERTSVKAVERLRRAVREQHLKTTEEAREALKDILVDMLSVGDTELKLSTHPSVILVIGVNGVGKTTTIGKIAKQLTAQGKKVMLVAGDTFRAAAADQLEIWAGRSGASIVRQHEGADPASVVFDGIQSAKARDVDVILIDTAGRLHNKTNLMNELNKISRIVARELPDAAKEVLLVLDGTTGQNGLIQAKQFKEIAGVTAIALTKLDGTAKGGIVIAVADALQIPVKFVGVGEQADDLMPFSAKEFVEALI